MIDMDGPCICPGDPDHDPHPTPCGAPNSGTGHGPWCRPCNTARLARISAGFAQIKAALGSTPDTGSDLMEAELRRGCGATKPAPDGTPTDHHPSDRCGQCPPWRCEDCGEMCSAEDLCRCWVRIEDLTLADIKALFATIDLGVTLRPTTTGDSDA